MEIKPVSSQPSQAPKVVAQPKPKSAEPVKAEAPPPSEGTKPQQSAPPPPQAQKTEPPKPVVNAQGQKTGQVINVTA